MKIPFDIKFRPQIESGEYKLETEAGFPAKVMDWEYNNKICGKCIAIKVTESDGDHGLLYTHEGKRASIFPAEESYDLFIVTPEEELTKFEKAFDRLAELYHSDKNPNDVACCKEYAAKLLALAIDARASELSEGLEQSKIDKDSIPYHLIEFMCNLYDCQNWKEIEDTAELYTTRVKAAALKDLPRWKKWGNGVCGNGIGVPLAIVKRGRENYKLVDVLCFNGEKYIMLSDLEKLPGFKED